MFYKEYDPGWLVEAAKPYGEEYPWSEESLTKCILAKDGGVYVHFVDSSRPNKPGSEWQFKENIVIEDTLRGDVILDVLTGNRIGGVEMFSELLEQTNA